MPSPVPEIVTSTWENLRAVPEVALILDMALALVFGFLFGYERSYHGRAAGMRTYGLVCMVSAALTSVAAHPQFWLGGTSPVNPEMVDPTRTIQGIVTGVGFLGAGIIMKDGLKISGLTTSASIWASAAIGVLVGLEHYVAAFAMTLLAEFFVMLGSRMDAVLPSRRPISVMLQFKQGVHPEEALVRRIVQDNGYELAKGSVTIQSHRGQTEWRFVAVAIDKQREIPVTRLAEALPHIEGIESFQLSRARN